MDIYDKIREEIKQDYYQQNFRNDGERFIAWYLRNIHLRDPNQTKYDITDGKDDKHIDAVIIDDDSSAVYIIQGKFIGAQTLDSEPLGEVLSSWLLLKDPAKLQEGANERLRQKIPELTDALEQDYTITFELVTTARLTENAKNSLYVFQEQIAKDEELSATLVVVDADEIKRRYDLAIEREVPPINFALALEPGKYLYMEIAQTKVVVAAIPLKDCLRLHGIREGTLFRKNVRQFMGLSNKVNKAIKSTIFSDKHKDFFFYHNGITAICDKLELHGSSLTLRALSVVNGCQSLNTILACSEKVKQLQDTYILFRFYEIPQRDRADRISISTNFQSPVKPRDLRSNDKRVLNLKRLFEQRYNQGYFVTKRGEEPPSDKDVKYVVDLVELGKWLISWHSQRPNIAYSENKIFDKYFEQLFKRDYDPENIQALNFWMQEIKKGWAPENPFGLNGALLAMKAYAPYHVLYAVSQFFAVASNQSDRVPSPLVTYQRARDENMLQSIVQSAASCLNVAIETAANQQSSSGRIFSPQNWVKTKTCLSEIKTAVITHLAMCDAFIGGKKFKEALRIPNEAFEYRWEAD